MINYIKQKYGMFRKLNDFKNDFKKLKSQASNTTERFQMNYDEIYPCLWDKSINTDYDHHYLLHVAWAARKIAEIKPKKHVDISSSLNFCSTISAFVDVEFYDFRPAKIKNLSNLKCDQADLTKLHFDSCSINSLSCMHTVEHIGLGRYGDPLGYDSDLKSIEEMKRVVVSKGNILFVVPIGSPKIMFNAHRIYSYEQIITYFEGFMLKEFSLITDDKNGGELILNSSKTIADKQEYGCGCFWFIKD